MKKSFLLLCAFVLSISAGWAQKKQSLKTISIDTVEVTAFRLKSDLKEIPQNIQVLTAKDIREIPNESVDQLLKKTSGVDVNDYAGFMSVIGIRGFVPSFSKSYTKILVNGLPAGTDNISTLDLSNATQVEVLKGPYSSFFGSGAMAGVINIVTPDSKDSLQGGVSASAGSFRTYSLNARAGGAITRKLNFDFSAGIVKQNADYKTGSRHILHFSHHDREIMGDTYGKTFRNTRYGKYVSDLRLGYDFSKRWSLNFNENLFMADPVYINGNFWGTYGSNKKKIQRWRETLTLSGNTGIHSIRISPYFSNENSDYYSDLSSSQFINERDILKSYGFVAQDGIRLGNQYIILGVDNQTDRHANENWAGRDVRTAPYQPDYRNADNGIFTQLKFSFLDNHLITALGARYDLIDFRVFHTDYLASEKASDTYHTFNPNLSLKYTFLHNFSIHGSAGTAFLAPTAFEKAGIYATSYGVYIGNPNLKADRSASYDLGISCSSAREGIDFDVTFFNNKQTDMVVSKYNATYDTITYINADNARSNGLDCSLSYDLGNLVGYRYSLKLYSNFTHLFTSKVVSGAGSGPAKYVRKTNASFGLEYNNFKAFSFRLNGRYIGHRFEDNFFYFYPVTDQNGNPVRPNLTNDAVFYMPHFLVFDLTGRYRFSKHLSLSLALQNLLDENYTETDGYNMPGRSVTLRLNYHF